MACRGRLAAGMRARETQLGRFLKALLPTGSRPDFRQTNLTKYNKVYLVMVCFKR